MQTTGEVEPTPGPSRCWCCGSHKEPVEMVHLGEHPEVTVCADCAHFLSKQAWELEDHDRTGIAVRARNRLRRTRAAVIEHGWQDHKIVGPGLRWIGRFTP